LLLSTSSASAVPPGDVRELQLGVLGFGRIGSLHARTIAEMPLARLLAVCDTDHRALVRAQSMYPVSTTTDLFEFLRMPLDGVVIASSSQCHAEQIAAAATAGIAVFSEKPIALTLAETDRLLMSISSRRIPFQIGFQRRWDRRFRRMKDVIDSGDVGQPVLFKAHGRDPDASKPANWGLDKNGGLFANSAIHDYDAARFLLGREVDKISATGATLVHRGLRMVGDLDICSTTLFFGDDAMALTEWSRFASTGYEVFAEVVGTRGSVRLETEQGSSVVILKGNRSSQTVVEFFGQAYRASLHEFAGAVREGRQPNPGPDDARAALQLATLARASFDRGGAEVNVPRLAPLG